MSLRKKNGAAYTVVIHSSPDQVIPYAQEVRASADQEKDALGFLPAPVYDDAAKRGNLYVAVANVSAQSELAGHLLFGGQFPHCRVFQTLVLRRYRRHGIGTLLVRQLISDLEARGYLSICANVADDLKANDFWSNLGFRKVREKPGGASKGRRINVRIRELDTPTLFAPTPKTRLAELGLVERITAGPAIYAIDLNVFWDVVGHRPRAASAAQVISAGFTNTVRLVVTSEFISELKRSSGMRPTDPALEFAMQLPTLPKPDGAALDKLMTELAARVFPSNADSAELSAHRRSDLVHLATAIHHDVQGFITSDDGLLRAGESIRAEFGIRLLHVEEFASAIREMQTRAASLRVRVSSETLSLRDLSRVSAEEVSDFLSQIQAPVEFRKHFLSQRNIASNAKSRAVYSDSDIVCLVSWDAAAPLQDTASVHLAADQDNPAAETVIDFVLGWCASDTTSSGPILLELSMPPGHVVSKSVAIAHGFRASKGSSSSGENLQKICVGRPVVAVSWLKTKTAIERCSGISLPDLMPSFLSGDQLIPIVGADHASRAAKLNELEDLLSPTLLVLPGRVGRLVPIRGRYAAELLGSSDQLSLLPNLEAMLFSQRVYFCTPRNARSFQKGVPLIFYESGHRGGRSCAIAVARIKDAAVVKKTDVPPSLLRHGVIETNAMDDLSSTDDVAAVTFDNVMLFRTPVKLARLRELGAIDRANLITSRAITHDQLVQILTEAYSRE
ncbi:MAG: GNAT family N-acetyltransferase [Candidatus Acidiferrales bacterium]|jgi:ribosomal protein S18 acetylase RimI-like enzyme/predicted nucleic acid-binding protein